MNRRRFVNAAVAAATPMLAAEGGKPLRATALKPGFWGTQFYDESEREQLLDVLTTQRPFRWYGTGSEPPNKALTFEKEFAARMQSRFALGVTSGTAALHTALAALGVGPGDEVILPAWTWHSCYSTIVMMGALPVFAEIDESFNLDPADFERKITADTKVVMAVHLLGAPCDMDAILAIARKRNIRVLEDCAQACGASYKGKPVGSLGDIAAFSLQINKTITAGEGGAVVTNDPVLFERASRFHDLGGLRAPHEKAVGKAQADWFSGVNYRLNEFSAGVLLAQVRKLDRIVAAVRGSAQRVYEGVRDLEGARFRHLPDPAGELGSGVYFAFSDKARRDRFVAAMQAENLPATAPSGSAILPVQPYVMAKRTAHPIWPSFQTPRGRAMQYGPETCPKTIDILNRFGGVPMGPKYSRADVADIVAGLRKVVPSMIG